MVVLESGYEPERIALAGDWTGGALTLATVVRLRERRQPLPGALALVSPGTIDMTYSGDTRITLLDWDTWLDGTYKDKILTQYVRNSDVRNPLVSPVFADYRGFPPMLIQVGTREWLLSDAGSATA